MLDDPQEGLIHLVLDVCLSTDSKVSHFQTDGLVLNFETILSLMLLVDVRL